MSELVRFKFYETALEANRDKQILAESDIQSFIANEQLIQSDWLLSQAVGGIQLQVFEEDVEKAQQVLQDYQDNEKYSLEVEHTIENPKFDFVCPKCGSNHIYRDDSATSFFGVSLLTSHKFVCYYCENEFTH
ncbi:putative signal transducing protein [Chryseobacterium tongliaoense]|uniref:putative signal transducing protein n=1 Tax=Chryseobacterium tongliaoense TaxID=3240933 RepID=UPI00351370CA